ncbi:Cell pattern formation-associated protein STUA [Erysiphe neolycopersici]|uniref:Cell pattern formation-associated protein STUA n=1 Tax=Erysiphe neolycopersici TaxID=212602 RepID=A0A420I7E1_9PEZI|nr:Cell pattern formation-associated protein STUA [Erysiphe neolycopersici]
MTDRLPHLPLPQPQQAYSSGTSSPRLSSIGSSIALNSSSLSPYSTGPSSTGPKTPSPVLPNNAALSISLAQTPYNNTSPLGSNYTYATATQDSYSNMNHNSQEMYYPSHLSTTQSHHPSQGNTSNTMSHFSPHQHSHHVQPNQPQYATSHAHYGQYNYPNSYPSQHSGNHQVSGNICHQGNVLPLPTSLTAPSNVITGQPYTSQQHAGFDLTGQVAPPGMKPKVTATLWEDEGSLCFQVEAKGVCVARREDNHMINGTKLLNVAGMTRGRRDGILKSEKHRHVVKIGPMHLKGVWIPFDRALEMANKEKITDILYPLFVQDIAQLLYHPANQSRANQVIAASERRKLDQEHLKNSMSHGLSTFHQHHPNMNIQGDPSHSLAHHPNWNRSSVDRVQNFPTPPTSASSVIGSMSGHEGNFHWSSQCGMGSVNTGNTLQIESSLPHSRSMPNTPASTPPGTTIQGIQYHQTGQSYDAPRHVYSTAPPPPPTSTSQQNIYSQSNLDNQSTPRYSSINNISTNSSNNATYLKSELAPSTLRVTHSELEGHETKTSGSMLQSHNQQQQQQHQGHDEEKEHDHDLEYTHGNSSNLNSSSEISTSPNHLNNSSSGRATPRTTATPQAYYTQAQTYNSSPRPQAQSSNLYNVISSERASPNNNHTTDVFSTTHDINSSSNVYSTPQQQNGSSAGKKRTRVDDDVKIKGRGVGNENDAIKRRKILIPSNILTHENPGQIRTTPPINQRRR